MNVARLVTMCCLLSGCRHSGEARPAASQPTVVERERGLFDITAPPYSARGDGVADDGPAIQAAIRAAATWGRGRAGAVVRVPSGTYRLTQKLALEDDVGAPARWLSIVGEGPTSFLAFDHKLADGHGDALRGDGVSDLVVRDLRIGALPGGVGYNRGIVLHGGERVVLRSLDISGAWLASVAGKPFGYPSGIFLDGGITDVRITDDYLHDNGNDDGNSWHIVVYGSGGASRVRIAGNRCITAPKAAHRANVGIGVFDSTDVAVEGNDVEGIVGTKADADGYGIMVYGSGTGLSHDHVIAANTVRHTDGAGIYVQGSPYSVVSGNVLEDTVRTQSSTSLAIGAIGFNQGPGTITGNVIHGVGVGSTARVSAFGIAIQTCSADRCTADDGTARGIAVTGNTIEQTAGYGIGIEAEPSMSGDNSTIIGNTMLNTRGGIGVIGDSKLRGLVIVGNSIVRAPHANPDGAPGIVLGGVTSSIIASNVVAGSDGQGIVLNRDASRNVVSGNIVREFGGERAGDYAGIQVSGMGNLVTGNQSYRSDAGGQAVGVLESGGANQILFNNVADGAPKRSHGIVSTGSHTVRAQNRMADDWSEGDADPQRTHP